MLKQKQTVNQRSHKNNETNLKSLNFDTDSHVDNVTWIHCYSVENGENEH